MIGSFTSRAITIDFTLDAVILNTTDVDGTTFHEEIFVARDTVAYSRRHVDSGILDGEVLTGLDGMFHITLHIKRTFLGKLGMSLNV